MAAVERGLVLNMNRTRSIFLATSLVVVLLFAGVLAASRSSRDSLFRALGNLAEVVHLVETEYVDELNQEALSLSLDAGLLESVDPWAAVLPPESVEEYLRLVESPPAFGLGLTSRLGSAAVRFVLLGSPAEKAELSAWEVIESVDGINTRGQPLWQIRLQLMKREHDGEPVPMTVFDRHVDERREVVLEPSEWSLRAATAELHEEATVIHLQAIPEGTADTVAGLVPEGGNLVLDLRQLGWGREEATMAVADLFVREGQLGSWQGRRAGSRTFAATPGAVAAGLPTVLVGPDTEGAGEILASALQRAGAVVVGHRTIGHAPHMSLIRDDGVAVWMPVGQWLRSDDSPINGNGIEPDEEVELASADEAGDPVLERAFELFEQELEEAA